MLDDAINLRANIDRILNVDETFGMWGNGLAVQGLYMGTFGKRDGLASVQEFLRTLRIEPGAERSSVFTLALKIVLKNNTEDHRYQSQGLSECDVLASSISMISSSSLKASF